MIEYLKRYQAWRRGEDDRTMDEAGLDPKTIGESIDWAIEHIAELERDNAAMSEAFNLLVNAVEENDEGTDVYIDLTENPRAARALMDDIGPWCVHALARRDKLLVADVYSIVAAHQSDDEQKRYYEDQADRIRREAEDNNQ